MDKKDPIKISLPIFITVIVILVACVSGILMYMQNQKLDKEIANLKEDISKTQAEKNELQEKLNGESKIINTNSKTKKEENEISKQLTDDKRIIAEKAYINYANGFQYKGMALFNDSTIYEWDYESRNYSEHLNVDTSEEYAKWILEHGTIVGKRIDEDELKEIKQYIDNIDDKIDKQSSAFDAGSWFIAVWEQDYKKVILKESGDYSGENKTDNSQKLIKILTEYFGDIPSF